MTRSTLAVVDSKRLLELFGPRDQHLRKIRTALDVGISARDGEIHIEGEDAAVHRATQIFESLDQSLRTDGIITEQIVERLLNGNTASEKSMHQESIEVHRPGGRIVPRSSGQAAYVRAIRQSDVVFCEGPAGCGKTFLAVAMAVSALREQQVTKIVLVRPAVEAGESLGFLPGDLQAKINPYLRPLLDALREMMDFDLLKKLTEQDVIEMIPLAYMRGRTLNQAFVILDEAQNTTASQMKMFLTRLGVGSKMVISGDTTQ
ncbi:MAG: AAA family ATPase, partial [Planctomycetaceae bacterium]|nr:AAA family ATPase [Planctomycetaceae bacterium]